MTGAGYLIAKNKQYLFLDLKKSFDTVDHRLLIKKLKYYNFSNELSNLIKNCLSDRTFYTNLDWIHSEEKLCSSYSFPQGSFLGALLFIIFIYKISLCKIKSRIALFADNTTIWTSNTHIDD